MADKKQQLKEVQELADKHSSLKNKIEGIISQGESIEDKLKESDRILGIKSAVESMFNDLDDIEKEYFNKIEEIKSNK